MTLDSPHNLKVNNEQHWKRQENEGCNKGCIVNCVGLLNCFFTPRMQPNISQGPGNEGCDPHSKEDGENFAISHRGCVMKRSHNGNVSVVADGEHIEDGGRKCYISRASKEPAVLAPFVSAATAKYGIAWDH